MSHDPLSVTLFLNFCDTDSLGHLRQLPVSQTRLSYTRPSIVPFSFYSLSFFGVGVYEFQAARFFARVSEKTALRGHVRGNKVAIMAGRTKWPCRRRVG